ncbi:hypothetical protein B0O99DRAFT_623802 [Bisporella sp. PMI_857]|nr:hypothetical protein B0O99DRAFT_623802 [Bisporella sp. PMI_857]
MIRQTRHGEAIRLATSCTECQRRKQKCSREWPCYHCQSRRISHLCQFVPKTSARIASGKSGHVDATKGVHQRSKNSGGDSLSNVDALNVTEDLRVLGYLPDPQNLQTGYNGPGVSSITRDESQRIFSPEMENALQALPPKPYADILVQQFLNDTNYHYYCLYPPTFTKDYSQWWADRTSGQTLNIEFTCLLLRVCTCSLQFLGTKLRQKLELELGETTQCLTERSHRAARLLSNTISPGKGGLTQIQQLFLTSFWFKTEARFIESWHILAAAIHEAQELGMYKGSFGATITEFDCEMRRRVWCLLYAWDWQMSLLLSRPPIINDICCSFELPRIQLENTDSFHEVPSPIAHMVLQCQLGRAICKIPGVVGGLISPAQAETIQQEVEKWLASFPPTYRVADPNIQWDKDYQYVALQRCQLHVVGYMMILSPLKGYLTRDLGSGSPGSESSFRTRAVSISLKLMEASHRLFNCIFPASAKFHFATFLIFDTASFLCSALIHDSARDLPQRKKVIEAVRLALSLMEKLCRLTKSGAISYAILRRLMAKLSLSPEETLILHALSLEDLGIGQEPPNIQVDLSSGSPRQTSTQSVVPTFEIFSDIPETSNSLDWAIPGMAATQNPNLNDLTDIDFGELDQIWDWENLDLSFDISSPVVM